MGNIWVQNGKLAINSVSFNFTRFRSPCPISASSVHVAIFSSLQLPSYFVFFPVSSSILSSHLPLLAFQLKDLRISSIEL
ncbi:hypothetical protein L6164_006864 [Bauhinia variegata]|uniref:Uncharacterized protein n=1 Tax=Bauhinia variegata TaxID=167791 RepID=A0ACB9PV61_BAUVA|nr:hypothetical protein L6164_006864 [Bauhinia variegata]